MPLDIVLNFFRNLNLLTGKHVEQLSKLSSGLGDKFWGFYWSCISVHHQWHHSRLGNFFCHSLAYLVQPESDGTWVNLITSHPNMGTARRTFKDYKGALSTAFHLKSNPALCWTAPPPGTHKYGRKIISFYLLFLIYLSLLHFFGNNHGLVENLLLSHLFSKFIS